eukprot:TRINITY_DN64800_c0_g1_i1.p1 TRINITY_DN64800_c0_g1~~TRINITY_DN64800_c0_g1_i1.p1  ORF type:complete len:1063 (+),score=404.40 TRINITY_DN64800_c0_g1_i1:115-3189(+)
MAMSPGRAESDRLTRGPPWRGDLRVGGGYAREGSPSPRRQGRRPQTPRRAVSALVKEYPARGVTAIEVIQGGATVWTGEADGSINVRNGFTGEVATSTRPEEGKDPVTISPHGEATCVRLFATETHMWAGMNDGGVRVFDHLVVVQVWPEAQSVERPHSTSVEFFCQLYDGSVLSGDIECNLIKWSGEQPEAADGAQSPAGPFQQLVRRPSRDGQEGTDGDWPRSLSALDASGTYVYIGDRTGRVHVLDADTLSILHGWDTGHGSVTAARFMDGLLFTGGSDHTIRIWQHASQEVAADLREPIKVITLEGGEDGSGAMVSRLISDLRAHLLWVVDERGTVTKLESTAPFAQRDDAQLHLGPFADIAAFTTWDAVRVWSTGSNGANFSWFAQWSRAEEQMQEAIDGMKSIISQDTQELDKWRKLIDEFSRIDSRRKDCLVKALEANTVRGLQHVYFRKWFLWLRKLHEVRRRMAIADCMFRNTTLGCTTIYWGKLLRYWQQHKTLRQKKAMCNNILATTTKGLRRIYWKKIDEFRHNQKREALKRQLGESLLQTTEAGVVRRYLRKTLRYVDRQKIQSKRQEYAGVLMRSTDSGLRRVYYFKMARFLHFAARRRRRAAVGRALAANTVRGMQRVYYRKFNAWGEGLKHQRQKKDLAESLRRSTARGLMTLYQQKCDLWLENYRKNHLEDAIRARREQLEKLKEQERAMQGRLERRRQLQEMREKKGKLEGDKAGLQSELDRLREEYKRLEREKEEKARHATELRKKAMTLDDAMSRLKEMALNFDSDYEAIQKMADRELSRQQVSSGGRQGAASPVCSAFLGAHMAIKAEVVKMPGACLPHDDNYYPADRARMRDAVEQREAGNDSWRDIVKGLEDEGNLKNPPWNLDGKFAKMQKFQYSLISAAIRNLVILYDMMTKADKDQITTDEEIVINAENLMHLCENGQRTKENRPKKEFNDSAWTKPPEGWTPWKDAEEGAQPPAWVRDGALSTVEYWKQLMADYRALKGSSLDTSMNRVPPAAAAED